MMTSLYYNATGNNHGHGGGGGGGGNHGQSSSPPSHQPLAITNVNAATFFDNATPTRLPPKSR